MTGREITLYGSRGRNIAFLGLHSPCHRTSHWTDSSSISVWDVLAAYMSCAGGSLPTPSHANCYAAEPRQTWDSNQMSKARAEDRVCLLQSRVPRLRGHDFRCREERTWQPLSFPGRCCCLKEVFALGHVAYLTKCCLAWRRPWVGSPAVCKSGCAGAHL